MIETKAIDENVKNLLLTVRNQAERYKSLFNELEGLRDAINNDINELRDISNKYEDKFNNEVIDLEVRYDNSIQSIEEKISQVKQLEVDYDKIQQHKAEFEQLLEKFEIESNEFTQAFVDFRFEIEKKIADQVRSIKSYVDKEIELESRTLESRIYDRIRKVDRHLEQYDKRIYEANKLQDETNARIFKQLRSLEGFMDSIKSITESMSRTFNSDLRNTESHLLEKIDIIEERQEKIKKIEFLDDILELDKAIRSYRREYEVEKERNQKIIHDYEKQISIVRGENKTLESEIKSNQTKSNIAIVTAVVSLLLMVVLVALI
jgi:DNA repair exonuclease SbcCD ATPase subunit